MSNEISEINAYYDELIGIERLEAIRLVDSIRLLTDELQVHNNKINELIKIKKHKVKKVLISSRDNDRYKKYRNIEIKKNDVFFVDIEPHRCHFKIGQYTIYTNHNVMNIRIEIIRETTKQYKLGINFTHIVTITNQRGYSEKSNIIPLMSIKKLNLNDFLSKNNKSFRREVTMSNLLE